MSKRPILLTVVSVLAILAALVALVLGYVLYSMSLETFNDVLASNPDLIGEIVFGDLKPMGQDMLIAGAILLVAGIMLFMGFKLAWYIAVIALVASLAWNAYTMITAGVMSGILTIVITLLVLLYLFTGKVKEHFGVGSS